MRISDWSSDVCSSDLLDFRGNNIADLYPLTGVPLPPSPPYQIAGDLDYDRASGAIRFRHVDGHYGQSDIAGDVSVIPAHGARRRKVTMVARSNKVDWSDLSGDRKSTRLNSSH